MFHCTTAMEVVWVAIGDISVGALTHWRGKSCDGGDLMDCLGSTLLLLPVNCQDLP
jgi:hypothetical protein